MQNLTIWRCGPAILGMAAIGLGQAWGAELQAIDWAAVPKSEIDLFYPGQSSEEWLKSPAHKTGAAGLRKDKNCLVCHAGDEAEIGKAIASGEKLEPRPIPGKPGSIRLTLQAAYDAEYLYLKASWPAKKPGIFHEYAIYRDGKWEEPYGSHRGNELVRSGETPPSYEDRFSVMIGDGRNVPSFASEGCWATCHNDMRFMPNEARKEEVQTHPILGKDGMKKSDIRKYIAESRAAMSETGGWDKIRSKEEIAALKDRGVFLDLWQWRANRSNPLSMADDGYVLEYRNLDGGKAMFADNWDKGKHQPKLMFDPARNNGSAALVPKDFQNPRLNVLRDTDAVPYDPNYKWQEGDLLFMFTLVTKPEGSVADNSQAIGTHAGGEWTVLWKRRLDTSHPKDDLALVPGRTYTAGLAVHDDNTTARWHYVSFPLALSLGGKEGQINAVRLK